MYRLGELSKSLSQQYSVASELRRNLEAEAALHTSNVSSRIVHITQHNSLPSLGNCCTCDTLSSQQKGLCLLQVC